MKHIINIIYILAWSGVSMLSSFIKSLDDGMDFFVKADFSKDIQSPMLVWLIAYLIDLIYSIKNINTETQQYSRLCIFLSYATIAVILFFLLLGIHWQADKTFQWISIMIMMTGMIALKAESIYVVEDVEKIIEI